MLSFPSKNLSKYSFTFTSLSFLMASLVLLGSRRLPGLINSSRLALSRCDDLFLLDDSCTLLLSLYFELEPLSFLPRSSSRINSLRSLTFCNSAAVIRELCLLLSSSHQLSTTLKLSIKSSLLKSSKKSLGISSASPDSET